MRGWIERPSPNFDARADGAVVDILVLHYTGMRTAEDALARLCDPGAKVSAHYTIDRDGSVYRHVDETLRARHAGISYWAGVRDVNSRSIGIELVNPGHEFGYVPFAEAQIESLIELSRGILARHLIPPQRVIGHSDVAPARKMDPGELFPWEQLAEAGIGVFPPPGEVASAAKRSESEGVESRKAPSAASHHLPHFASLSGGGKSFASRLARFGYGVPPEMDSPLETVITAFQRHFRPDKVDGVADEETDARLSALLEMIQPEDRP